MVMTRNLVSGQVADIAPKMLEHPKFKAILEVVSDNAKPFVPELHKPRIFKAKEAQIETPEKEEEV
jgi:hypothetical protein